MLQYDQNKQKYQMIGKVLAIGIIGFMVAPIIVATIQGIVGLVIAGAVAYGSVQFAPVFGNMVANLKLKALKYEASKRPVETLENDYVYRTNKAAEFKKRIEASIGEVNIFRTKLAEFKKKFPDQAQVFDEQYDKAHRLVQLRIKNYEEVQRGLVKYAAEIDKARAFWDLAQAAIAMNKSAEVDSAEVIRKIQTETAVDSIQKTMAISFAATEMALAQTEFTFDVEETTKDKAKVKTIKNVTPTVQTIEPESRDIKIETLSLNTAGLSDRI